MHKEALCGAPLDEVQSLQGYIKAMSNVLDINVSEESE